MQRSTSNVISNTLGNDKCACYVQILKEERISFNQDGRVKGEARDFYLAHVAHEKLENSITQFYICRHSEVLVFHAMIINSALLLILSTNGGFFTTVNILRHRKHPELYLENSKKNIRCCYIKDYFQPNIKCHRQSHQ